MNLDKAIRTGEQYIRDGEPHDLDDFIRFVKLGIEALKAIVHSRKLHGISLFNPLPGETKDEPTTQEQSLKRGNEILALGRKMIKETDELLGKPTSSS